MNTVAGVKHKQTDKSGTYRKACALLAKDLGWKLGEVYDLWQDLALMHEFESRWPRPVAEWQAMHDVMSCLVKPGQEGD